jgi:molybdate/tungstate transport system substrate-binding protein
MRRALLAVVLAAALVRPSRPLSAQAMAGDLVVFNAGSLGKPFADLLRAFAAAHPGVEPKQEISGSVEAARKITELGKIPDMIAVADYGVIPKLLIPRYASWYVNFARNAMVLAYTDQSVGAEEITPDNWWRILLRPGVRVGRADPVLDPNGYRALMVCQLAERFYREPGLAARLERAVPPRYVRPKEADLTALVQAGELDYAWSYSSVAKTAGLRFVDLPPELDLSDPARAAWYRHATVRIPGRTRAAGDSVTFVGEPIVYALTIPTGAPHPAVAAAFARFVLSADGRAILERNGFVLPPTPELAGPGKPIEPLF